MINYIKKYKFIIFLFIFSFLIRLIYILIIKTPITSDFKTMYDASRELLAGTHQYRSTSYFTLWGYQIGHSYFQYLLLKICNSILFLKLINVIITSLIVIYIYLILSKFVSCKTSKIMSILYSIFPFPLFLNSVLTNQHLPLLLTLISIYILLNTDFKNNNMIIKSIIVGLLLGISNILRTEGIVILFSILIFYIFIIREYGIKRILLSFMLIFSIYMIIFKGTSYIFQKSNISTNGLNNMNTYWKFVCGLNYETNGVYSEKDAVMYSQNKELAKKETINRLKQFKKLPVLFIKKVKILLLNSDLSWSIGHIKSSNTKNILKIINKIFIITFIILAILGINNLFNLNKTYLLCSIILFIYIGIYLLIEVMPRYAYSLQPFIVILAGFGLDNVFNYKKRNN